MSSALESISQIAKQRKSMIVELSGDAVEETLNKLDMVQKETSRVRNIGEQNAHNLQTLGE